MLNSASRYAPYRDKPTSRRAWTERPRGGSLLVLALLLAGAAAPAFAQDSPFPLVNLPGPGIRGIDSAGRPVSRPRQAVANRLIVGLRPGAGLSGAQAVARRVGGRVRRLLPRSHLAVIELPPGLDSVHAIAAASLAPEAEFVEPDIIVYLAKVPADPRYGEQWHHPMIKSPQAWDITTGSRKTIIAIIDSGADLDHPDLKSKIYTNPGEIPNNGKDDDHNGFIDDVHGWDFVDDNNNPEPSPDGKDNDGNGEIDDQVTHGTLVAGLAAAAANDFGAVGTDWKAQILPLQVFPDDGGTAVDTVQAAMEYAVDMGVDVINLSLGAPSYVRSFDNVIRPAYRAGITVVVASGNGGEEFTQNPSTWRSPVCNDGPDPTTDNFVLGVGATDRGDRRPAFSNFDSSGYRFVDVSAPGQDVFGPGYQNSKFPQFTAFFARGNGTSFSSPIVAGLVTLLKAQQPGISNAQIIKQIRKTTDNIDHANPGFIGKLGTGRINAARTLGVDVPPAAVRNLRADDTKGDQGGSITLLWLRSTDDGAGAQDVTDYIVKRSRRAGGGFERRATLPPGTESYEDKSAADHVDYYYVVTTRDAVGQETDSSVVGPASARDDLPPPALTGVAAADRPGDGGGAIRVRWDRYVAPGDFAEFRIYRAQFAFVTVTAMTPIATLADSTVRAHVDDTTTDGVDYWYAVTAADGEPNELTDVIAVGPVQSFPNRGVAIEAGMHLLATPVVPRNRDPAAFFGIAPEELVYARFDPTAGDGQGQYLFYHMAPDSPFLDLSIGRGFWFEAPQRIEIDPAGGVAPAGPFGIDLEPGWRQVGNPFISPTDFTQATVERGALTMDLASADAAGIMRRFAWVYNSATGDYELIDRVVGAPQRLVAPWQGFWVNVFKPCRLVLDRSVTTTSVASQDVRRTGPSWQVKIIARAGGSVDAANYFGVASDPGRLDVEAPPSIATGVRLSFWKKSRRGVPYAAVFRPASAGIEWSFSVTNGAPGDVVISTPDLSGIPPEYGVILTDVATGRKVALRTSRSYRYTSARAGAERHFRIAVRRRTSGLVVSGLTALPTRGGAAEVRFVLTADASCDVEVMNIAGRPVRQLAKSRLYDSGQQVISWNGRNDSGVPIPNGTYLIRVRARSDSGETAQALSMVSVVR